MSMTPRFLPVFGAILAVVGSAGAGCAPWSPPPRFEYVGSRACGDVVAYSWNAVRTEQLFVAANIKNLGLSIGQTRALDLSSAAEGLVVLVETYVGIPNRRYCSCLADDVEPMIWRARSGLATITLSKQPELDIGLLDSSYLVVIKVENLVLTGPRGATAVRAKPITLAGQGGWLPG